MKSASIPAKGAKTRIRQSANRARYDREALYEVLDACNIGHVSFVHEGWPQSIPTAIARVDDQLYLHGHPKSRLYLALTNGDRVCVSVCRVDGLVKARSAFHCSMNYRSAVIFGQGEVVAEEEKPALLDAFTEKLIPGSLDDFRPYLTKELKGTVLIRLAMDEASVKIRDGDPVDDKEDLNLAHWAGVIPIDSTYAAPQPAADLPAGVHPSQRLLAGAKP